MSRTPWHVRTTRKHGQSAVLYSALALSAPGEYALATLAGWSPWIAWLMPGVMSLYAAISASIAKRQKEVAREARGTDVEADAKRRSRNATWGALLALAGATAAQITDHVLTTGAHGGRAWVVIVVSAIPPMVAAHVLHIDPPEEEGEEVPAVAEPVDLVPESVVEAAWKPSLNKTVPGRVIPMRPLPLKLTPADMLSIPQAASRLGVAASTLYRRRDNGTLPVHDVSGQQRVRWSDVAPVNAPVLVGP